MSTRGCVAVRQEGNGDKANDYGMSWRGVYNHSDSYPPWLGKEVHAFFAAVPPEDLPAVLRAMLEHDDWRDFLAGGLCEYCGKKGLGQPHSISGEIFGYESDGKGTVPDPEGKYHEHNNGPVERQHVTSERPGPLFIEWVYIVDPLAREMSVLNFAQAEQLHQYDEASRRDETLQPENLAWNYGHCAFRHLMVGTYSLDEPFDTEVVDKAAAAARKATGFYEDEDDE